MLYDDRSESFIMHLTWDALASCVGVLNAGMCGPRSWIVPDFRLLRKVEVGERSYKRVRVRRKMDARSSLMKERHDKRSSNNFVDNVLSRGLSRFQRE